MAELVKASGERKVLNGRRGNGMLSLAQLQGMVGGLIDFVGLGDARKLIVRAGAERAGLPLNPAASRLAGRRVFGDAIVGRCEVDFE